MLRVQFQFEDAGVPVILLLQGCLLDKAGYLAARALLTDDDHDGYSESEGDCDDANPSRYPGATESCDGVDNDCDGLVDEDGGGPITYPDADGDGYGDAANPSDACVPPATNNALGGDCDDTRASIHPDAVETCDGVDQDCNGVIDDNATDAPSWYVDADGDGYAAGPDNSVKSCTQPDGYTASQDTLDCDDSNPSVYPGAPEVCGDGVINDCNATDECRYEGLSEPGDLTIYADSPFGALWVGTGQEFRHADADLILGIGSDDAAGIAIYDGPIATSTPLSAATAEWEFATSGVPLLVLRHSDTGSFDGLLARSDSTNAVVQLDLAGGRRRRPTSLAASIR